MISVDLTKLSEEVANYRQKVEANPKDADAWFSLGYVYTKQQKYDLAENAYSRSLELEESADTRFHVGEMLYDRKLYGKALNHLLEALNQEDTSWQHYREAEVLVDSIYALDSCSL